LANSLSCSIIARQWRGFDNPRYKLTPAWQEFIEEKLAAAEKGTSG